MSSTEVPTCYICYEEETAAKPFLNKQMCACTSKADSSLKIHQLCLELMRDRSFKCSVCKTALSTKWAFDESYKVCKFPDHMFVTKGEPEAPHGTCFKLVLTGAMVGPVRYLSELCNYQFGEKHGLQLSYSANGAQTELNYKNGQLHGAIIDRDENGKVQNMGNYVHGKLHGAYKKYVAGVLRNQVTYENNVLNGPVYMWDSDSKLLCKAEYKNGFRHGRFVSNQVIHRDCKVTEEFWSDGTQELRHGLHRIESDGKVYLHAQYKMGKRFGPYVEHSTFSGQLVCALNFRDGKLHGRCEVYEYVCGYGLAMMAHGSFSNGTQIGRHVLYGFGFVIQADGWHTQVKSIRESVNYDGNGQLHGTCIFNTDECVKSQILNYKHGVLHGKQTFYTPDIVFHMKHGVVCKMETVDERGVIQSELIDEGVCIQDLIGDRALRHPAERLSNGAFEERYLDGDCNVQTCEIKATGSKQECNCDDCYLYEPDDDYDDYSEDDNDRREYEQERREYYDWVRRQRY